MRRKLFAVVAILSILCSALPLTVAAAPAADEPPIPIGANTDNPSHPLGDAQTARHEIALQAKLNGKANGPVKEVAKGQFVQLERQGEDSIWTIIGEFGNAVHPILGGTPGPLHNQIPQPDRSVDNTTIWAADFSKAYYENMLFSSAPGAVSMRNFYIEQSSNRYTVNGDVTDWVQVPYNEAFYGSDYCGGIVCAQTWYFVNDSADAWYNAQIAFPAQWDPKLGIHVT